MSLQTRDRIGSGGPVVDCRGLLENDRWARLHVCLRFTKCESFASFYSFVVVEDGRKTFYFESDLWSKTVKAVGMHLCCALFGQDDCKCCHFTKSSENFASFRYTSSPIVKFVCHFYLKKKKKGKIFKIIKSIVFCTFTKTKLKIEFWEKKIVILFLSKNRPALVYRQISICISRYRCIHRYINKYIYNT